MTRSASVTSARTAPADRARPSSAVIAVTARAVADPGGASARSPADGFSSVPLDDSGEQRPELLPRPATALDGNERALGQLGDMHDRVLDHGRDQILLGREVPVERPDRDTGPPGDGLHGRVHPGGGHKLARRAEDAGAVTRSVRSHLDKMNHGSLSWQW
jgi:hypothetical protein